MRNKSAYIWGGIERFLPEGLYLITNIILAHFLTPQDFGSVGVLAIFIAIGKILTDSGLGGSLVKEDTITKIDCSTVFVFNLSVSLGLYLILYFCAGLIEDFYNIPNLRTITRLLCIIFVINSFGIVPKSILIKDVKFKEVAIASTSGIIVASIISLIGCYFKMGVYVLVIFQISSACITTITLILLSHTSISFRFSSASFRKLVSFGVFTTLCGIIDSIYENILSILFGKFIGVKFVGYYDQAKKLERGSASSISGALNNVSFPILSKLKNNESEFQSESLRILKQSILIFFPLLSLISIYSDLIIRILFGLKWIAASPVLSVLMINGMIFITESNVRNNIKSLGRVKELVWITLIKRIIGIGIIISFIAISKFAMLYGLVVSTFFGLTVNLVLFCRLTKVSFLKYTFAIMKYTLTPIIYYLVCIAIKRILINSEVFSIGISIVIIIFYYLINYRYAITNFLNKEKS